MNIWYYTYKKQLLGSERNNVCSHMNYLQFAFKAPKCIINIVFCRKFRILVIVPGSELCLQLVFFELFGEK